MRRRLLIIVFVLVAGIVAALGLPLATASAEQTSQEVFISRAADTARFADAAESALAMGRTVRLVAEMERYDALYDTAVLVVDADGQIIASSREGLTTSAAGLRAPILRGLAGRPPQRPHVLWPWDDRPYVVVEPVVRDNRVLGAAVTVSPTDRARGLVTDRFVHLGVGFLVALLVVTLAVSVPVVRWVLRPVQDLDEAAHAMESGRLATRVSERAGPPELRRLARSFNAMADSVAAAVQKQRAFVAQASHQLRNPLTALRLRMENAGVLVSDPDGRMELRLALEEADRLGETVDALLRLARAESTTAVPQPLDVSAAIRRRAVAWQAAYAGSNTPLVVDAPVGVIVECLPDLLEHALDALLDNALKFGRGSPVQVQAASLDDAVEIRVRDTGPGLPGEELARAGERFWRSPRHQNVPGTGLGLAITRTLAEESGGSMTLSAVRPHGLEVLIRLPASDGSSGTSGPRLRADPGDGS
ncbi:HAMP domain-containing sensor histidine kinase [Rhizohabitans arisaemae]|uniref:HAMP domain-containing sensor histidine kinase n=1 Tax=Rhizohabitans arisaemae TaxID=2720610 RepID=UPI0024B1B89D|nr:HAMP domain-containing sensor histidine kinase [Rhizohabitans arisaemae]